MSRFTKVLLIIGLALVAMLVLTYASPAIKTFAQGLALSTKLPLWLVGLAAPILFVFKRLGGLLAGLLGDSPTERSIRDTNDAIKAKLDQVDRDVQGLDQWRRDQIEPRMARIAQLEQGIAAMEGRAAALSATIPGLDERQQQALAEQRRLERELGALPRIRVVSGTPIQDQP